MLDIFTGPWWCLLGFLLCITQLLKPPSLNTAMTRYLRDACIHWWSRAGQHNATVEGRKHREFFCGIRANIFQSSVLRGGRPGLKYLKLNQTSNKLICSYTSQVVLKNNLQSFHLWHKVSLSFPSKQGSADVIRSREQCPGSAILGFEEADFLAEPSTHWPPPALWFSVLVSVVIR